MLLVLSCSPKQCKEWALGAPSKLGQPSGKRLPRANCTGKQSPLGRLSVPRGGGSSLPPLPSCFHSLSQAPSGFFFTTVVRTRGMANFSLAEGFWIPQLCHHFSPSAAVSNPSFSLPTMTSTLCVCSNLGQGSTTYQAQISIKILNEAFIAADYPKISRKSPVEHQNSLCS